MPEREVINRDSFESLQATPGWVVCERVTMEEARSAGGLVLPTNEKNNPGLIMWAKVVSCGPFYDARSGEAEVKDWWNMRWPIKAGTLILFHPHSPWEIRGSGKDLIAIKSNDVIAVSDQEGDTQ